MNNDFTLLLNPIIFIGGGNMARAIMAPLLDAGASPSLVTVIDPHEPTRQRLHMQWDIQALSPQEGRKIKATPSTLVVWAVKPQDMEQACQSAAPSFKKALHVSIVAGVKTNTLKSWLGTSRIVRTMPNTPALIGYGMTALFASKGVSKEDQIIAEALFSFTGLSTWVQEESLLNAVTALSGSGPAYVFYFIETLLEAGMKLGLDRDLAYTLVLQTLLGSFELAKQSNEPPEVLREKVTSKGGTTFAALESLSRDGVRAAFVRAIEAAARRAWELGEQNEKGNAPATQAPQKSTAKKNTTK